MKFKVGDKVYIKEENKTGAITQIDEKDKEYPYLVKPNDDNCLSIWYGDKHLKPIACKQTIEIKQKKNKVSAVLFENGKYIKHANAYCNPADTFNFKIGRDLAIKRLLDIEDKPPKEKFKPYLKLDFTGTKCGNIGEETIQVDLANNKLFVGDTVDIYEERIGYWGEHSVVKSKDYKNGAIQGVASRTFHNGKNGEFIIVKKRSYRDVSNGEIVGSVKYIKEEI